MKTLLLLFLAALVSSTTFAQYDPALAAKLGADEYGMKKYVLVLLKKGTGDASQEEKQKAFQGHMANIQKLAAENKLVLAGPVLADNPQKLVGIFVFNTDNFDAAKEMLAGDPAVAAHLLEPELYAWYGTAALQEIPVEHGKIQKRKPGGD
ncbi:MAG: hypothetical protein JO117_03655 [Verrucomicrobia bacterium]|nr:hypothetical protein [Verrucomicrobiota bacterium]MBV9656550.1 hypothetical protein [Verrucomicrobiota bacterium]